MSTKRTKQYLMLLMVIGLVSIAAGGSGTFASFSAETANDGNYFATGSLILNDKGNTTTCTSASSTTSENINTTDPTGCDTLFTLDQFTLASADVASASATDTSITFSGLTAPIYDGDTLTISDANNSETVTASSNAKVGDTSVTISDVGGLANSYTNGTVVDETPTYFANLTLTNAGSIDANGIKFKRGGSGCADRFQEPTTAIDTGGALTSGTAVTSINVTAIPSTGANSGAGVGIKDGQPVVVKSGSHYQTFIANGDAAPGDTVINVISQDANFSYPDASQVSGPDFGTGTLCDKLRFSIVETESGFGHDATTKADGCAYGTADPSNASTGVGCLYGDSGNDLLNAVPNSLQTLNLKSGAGDGNTAKQLDASGVRYFVLAVHFDGATFDNTYQNRAAAAFDLIWHIDQA